MASAGVNVSRLGGDGVPAASQGSHLRRRRRFAPRHHVSNEGYIASSSGSGAGKKRSRPVQSPPACASSSSSSWFSSSSSDGSPDREEDSAAVVAAAQLAAAPLPEEASTAAEVWPVAFESVSLAGPMWEMDNHPRPARLRCYGHWLRLARARLRTAVPTPVVACASLGACAAAIGPTRRLHADSLAPAARADRRSAPPSVRADRAAVERGGARASRRSWCQDAGRSVPGRSGFQGAGARALVCQGAWCAMAFGAQGAWVPGRFDRALALSCWGAHAVPVFT